MSGKKRKQKKLDKKAARDRDLAERLMRSRLEVRDGLEQAMKDQTLVRLRSKHRKADPVDGFVVALGRRWAALALVDDASRPNGWDLVRLREVAALERRHNSSVVQQILTARDAWPLAAPEGIAVDRARELTDALVARAELVSVHVEGFDAESLWLGLPISHRDGELEVHEINVRGRWSRRPTFFDVKAVTRYTLGNGYADSLALVAGVRPALASAQLAQPAASSGAVQHHEVE